MYINKRKTISLNGIGQDIAYTISNVRADLKDQILLIAHEFHVVADKLTIPSDGILGLDFVKKYKGILDFQHDQDW